MKWLRLTTTILLGLLLLFDALVGLRLWIYGWPRYLTVTTEGPADQLRATIRVTWIRFSSSDWALLVLFVGLHLALAYGVWRTWRAASAK